MFKKSSLTVLSIMTAAFTLTGCGAKTTTDTSAPSVKKSDRMSIVCTIFPEYDWVREVMGDHVGEADITYLLDSGTDLHNYQPTASDMLKISTCDLFIHVGGESDKWVDDALDEAVNKDMKVIDLMELLGDKAKVEELKEGMQEEEHDHDDDEDEEEEHEEVEYDEHLWLSLRNAKLICTEIANVLSENDPKNAEDSKSNLADYTLKLDSLDNELEEITSNAQNKTLIFGDRFPFRYFCDDYGIDYYAAFVGCSAESEASFETINFLARKLDELGCDTIFTLENSDKSIAEAVIRNSGNKNCEIGVLDSIQSITANDVKSGVSYLSLMQQNYDVLKKYID